MDENLPPPTLSLRGGARIGFVNWPWPLAGLQASAERLTVTTTMFGLFEAGRYTFGRSEVTSINVYQGNIFGHSGIQIHHTNKAYPERIIFCCDGERTIDSILAAGFMAAAPDASGESVPTGRGFPFRWQPLVILLIIWNALIGCEFLTSRHLQSLPGPLSLAAMLLVLSLAVATRKSPVVQKVILRPGRNVGEIKPVLDLVIMILGIMSVMFAVLVLLGNTDGASPASKSDHSQGPVDQSILLAC